LTQRLFWQDAYRREFEASVVERLQVDGHPAVVLDQTCFYPTSGGQPHDTGVLGDVSVLEVREQDGRLLHLLEAPAPERVAGRIDWDRRWDHMQQHTGQHILSQAFERELGAETLSFHLGEEVCTIDLDAPTLETGQVSAVVELANRIVLQDRAVSVREYGPGEAQGLSLRKAPRDQDSLRVVTIERFDVCACGGTHVRVTGEVGPIHIRRWSKQRGGARVEFLCGWRALRDYRRKDTICYAVAGRLSTGVEDLADAVGRLMDAEQAARREAEALRGRLLALELPRLAAEAENLGQVRVLCRKLEGYDAGNMRYLAQELTRDPGMIALLAVALPAPQVCFARSDDVSIDVGQLLREVLGRYGGKGGGRPHMAQGGGVSVEDLDRLLADAREQVVGR